MTLGMWIKRALCFLVGHREYDDFSGGRRCLRCQASYSYLSHRWRHDGGTRG